MVFWILILFVTQSFSSMCTDWCTGGTGALCRLVCGNLTQWQNTFHTIHNLQIQLNQTRYLLDQSRSMRFIGSVSQVEDCAPITLVYQSLLQEQMDALDACHNETLTCDTESTTEHIKSHKNTHRESRIMLLCWIWLVQLLRLGVMCRDTS
jgi:hypothetical protein